MEIKNRQSFEKYSKTNFMKIYPVRAVYFHADKQTHGQTDGWTDWQTDVTKLIVVYRNFVNNPKKDYIFYWTDRYLRTL
jgi:hypothetical protein